MVWIKARITAHFAKVFSAASNPPVRVHLDAIVTLAAPLRMHRIINRGQQYRLPQCPFWRCMEIVTGVIRRYVSDSLQDTSFTE
jgi:hypothetical protein